MEKFSKSYEPGEVEPVIYAMWEKSGVFAPSAGAETYSLVMPPPNANGNLHIGHGLTVAVEDALARYHRLRGEATWYVPGADHAGFETWVVYERLLEKEGKSRFDYTRDELYAQVWDFVAEQRGNMELQLRALGASCDWDGLTFTLDKKVVDRVYETFHKMWDEGLIYRGEKLVNYCTHHQTAFADIEVKYEEEKTPLYYIKYGPFVLATTRPETKFGDTGVAVNPNDERYAEWVGKTITVEGVNGPFEVKVVADDMVDMKFGTGVVKITPAHDFNDWETGQRHGLQAVKVVGEDGRMTELAGRFAGMTVKEARKAVVEAMDEMGMIVKVDENYVNKVPHCYKCGTVIEPMLREQWFVKVEGLAERAIEAIEEGKIKFYPASKKKVLINYYKGLKDWNISRQIPWGIPIPAFRSEDGEWIFDDRVNELEIEVDGKRYVRDDDTFDTWFSSSHWPIVTTDAQCTQISASEDALLTRRMSNTSRSDAPSSLNSTHPERPLSPFYPLSVMETAGDILFAWVARMIMMGLYVTGEVPFRDVYLHGLVLDGKGQKMSKSKGNVINPMELIGEYGSDAFRLGIIRSRSAGMNQAFSEAAVVAGRNLCNKLWNIARLVQNMVDEGEGKDASLPYTTENMGEDWICREINEARKQIEKMYKGYRFAEVEELIYELIWDKYADWFLESQKMYRNTSLLQRTLTDILVMLHPLAPFVTEAIWQTLSWTEGMCIEQKWPSKLTCDPISASSFEKVQSVVLAVRRVSSALSEASAGITRGEKYSLLFHNDSLIDDNQVLIQRLTGVPGVVPVDLPRGIRLAVSNSEIYLDAPVEVVAEYRGRLEAEILKVGKELDVLNGRLMNPRYVEKAPAELVEETRRGVAEKEGLIEGLKRELDVI